MKTALLFIVLMTLGGQLKAQKDWLKFPTDSVRSVHAKLNYKSQRGKVTIHKDARLDKLAEFNRSGEDSVEGVKIKGYRIVIFFDQDKSIVSQQRANFLARYKEHRAYVDYVAPNYRVRVGNFRSRLEAEGLRNELLPFFPTAVVVDEFIQLPNLSDE